MVQAPILHVNGDDPEAVVFAAELAMDYRMKFSRDVVIDMICYRRHGHSEADEPAVTQPLMYQRIRNKDRVDQMYFEQLLKEGILQQDDYQKIEKDYIEQLSLGKPVCGEIAQRSHSKYVVDYRPFRSTHWTEHVDTGIRLEDILGIGKAVTTVPNGFKVHRNVNKIIENRKKMSDGRITH